MRYNIEELKKLKEVLKVHPWNDSECGRENIKKIISDINCANFVALLKDDTMFQFHDDTLYDLISMGIVIINNNTLYFDFNRWL